MHIIHTYTLVFLFLALTFVCITFKSTMRIWTYESREIFFRIASHRKFEAFVWSIHYAQRCQTISLFALSFFCFK